MRRWIAAVPLVLSGLVAPSLAAASTPPHDPASQAVADAVIASFEQRMLDAGWAVEAEDPDDEDDDDGDIDIPCGDQFASFDELDAADFALGEAESPEYGIEGQAGEESFIPDSEFVSATVLILTPEGTELFTQWMDLLGSAEGLKCMEAEMAADLEGGEEQEGFDVEYGVSIEPDLGVGERSLGFDIGMAMTIMGFELDAVVRVLVATSGETVAMLMHGRFGDPLTELDPLAELQTLLDDVDG